MTVVKQYGLGSGPGGNKGGSPFGIIGSLIMLVVGLVLAYLVVKGIFTLLMWFSIPLLIAGIVMDPNGAMDFGKSLVNVSKKNPLIPIGIIAASALFFPTVPLILAALTGGFLLAKALVKKKFKQVFDQHAPKEEEEEFVEYEDVTEEDDFLDLEDVKAKPEPQARTNSKNEYEDLF